MNKDIHSPDLSNLDLEPKAQQIILQLLNHIEVLTSGLEELKKENQDLRDEIARLKGGKGKPRNERIEIDREEVLTHVTQ